MVGKTAARKKARFDDQVRFLRSWIESPLKTGAVAPSSPELAAAMAEMTDPRTPGLVVELGPGTGVVTAALLARGFAPERLLAIEYNPDFVPLLTARFPGARIVRGDAYDLANILRGQGKVAAIVSSLPLFTESPDKRLRLARDSFELLHPGAPFVQFSYALVSPVPRRIAGMTVHASEWILKNVPPARVWTYRRS